MKKPDLQSTMAFVDGKFYKVESYPFDPWESVVENPLATLKKGVVYRYETDITKGL